MPNEIEAKYRVDDFVAVRKALKAAGATVLGTMTLTDQFFDTPDHALRQHDCGLRLRSVKRVSGDPMAGDYRAVLTFKGPRQPHESIKIRGEIETPVDSARAGVGILSALGYGPTFIYQKRRTSWRLGRCRIELDELPLIGMYVEVEGPSEKLVATVCRKLGLTSKPILNSYVALLTDHCRRRRISHKKLTPWMKGKS